MAPRERRPPMSGGWDAHALLAPISAEHPCGQNPDETGALAAFDALRLFGQARSPEAAPDAEESDKEAAKAKPPIEWGRIRSDALDALARSKDLRLLAYLATALLRTDGLVAFTLTLTTASQWLDTYWRPLYPALDEDAIARRNALNCFADPMAVVDRLWRLPLVTSRQHGRYSLRDIDIARGAAQPGALEAKPDEAAIRMAFKEIPLDELHEVDQAVANGIAALNAIDTRMRAEGGQDVAPDFGALSTHLSKLSRTYKEELGVRTAAAPAATGDGQAQPAGFAVGVVTSRQDAIRALEAVAEYFRRIEPSSPIPLLVERAKRLVAKDFLDVLADIAPDAVAAARAVGGLKDQ